MKCYQVDNAMEQICDGTSWNNVPRLLKKVTLTSAGDTISVTGIPLRDTLRVLALFKASGNIAPRLTINNDTGNNYAYVYNFSGTGGASVSQPGFIVRPVAAGTGQAYSSSAVIDISNSATVFKIINCEAIDAFGADATTSVNYGTIKGKYTSANQATRIDFLNAGTGDFAIGSYVEMLMLVVLLS